MWQRRRIGLVPAATAVLLGWAAYSLVAGEHGLLAIAALERDRDRLHAEIAAIEAQIAALSERLGDDSRNAYVLEKTARETYGLARSGEIVYRFDADAFVDPDERQAPLAAGPRLGGDIDRRTP
jgi:cell division protein FtsB